MQELRSMNAEELTAIPLPPPDFVVDRLLPMGLSLLGGAPKAGKSWLVLLLAMRITQGLPIWDRDTMQCDVLYLCLEDTFPRIQQRLFQMTKEEEAVPELHLSDRCEKLRNGLEEQISQFLEKNPETKLVIIDTFQRVRQSRPDKGSLYAMDYEDISCLKALADRERIAILLVHHLRKMKDKDDPFNELAGSTGLLGALDTCLILKKDRRDSSLATLLVTGRDVEDQSLPLQFRNCQWEIDEDQMDEYEEAESEADDRRMTPSFLYRVWRFMEFRDTWEGTATDLIRDMQEIDVKPKSVTSLLSQYCYNFLEPNRILFRTHRTSKCRMIYLSHIPKADVNDEDDEDDANDECDE